MCKRWRSLALPANALLLQLFGLVTLAGCAASQPTCALEGATMTSTLIQASAWRRTRAPPLAAEGALEEPRTSLAVRAGVAILLAACVLLGFCYLAAERFQWRSSSEDAEDADAGAAAPVQIGVPIPEASVPHGLVGIFESNASTHPSSAALVDAESRAVMSYGELAKACRALAATLGQAGIGKGDIVGLLLEPSCQFVIATMGVMQAGAAWLPLDLKSPGTRLQRLLGRAEARLVLASQDFSASLVAPVPVLALGAGGGVAGAQRRPPPLPPRGGPPRKPGIAAVFYTSGSTGEPKAVMYGTETLCHGALTFGKLCRADSSSVFLVKTPTIWAVTEYEVFTPLAVGAHAAVDTKAQRDPIRLADTIRAHGVSVLVTSAPVLQLLADERLPSLRQAVNVGAAMPVEVCAAVQSAFGAGLSIHNLYGCTETPCLYWTNDPSGPPHKTTLVPAGCPQPGVEVHVLDAQGRPVAVGQAGEVYIGGPYVSLGYLDDEQLTQERFLPSPSGSCLIYRTGDVGRWARGPNGLVALQIEGRVDRQLNINGVRVAPEEVEGVLSQAPGVREVALVVVGGEGSERLVACVAGDRSDLTESVAERSSGHLPSHMRPAGLLLLDALPRLGNGKVDLTSLSKQASEELKGSHLDEVEAVDSLGRMRKVKRGVQHELQVMSALRALATAAVMVYHWYWEHWVDYQGNDSEVKPDLLPAWHQQGSEWFRLAIRGGFGIVPWSLEAFITMSGYQDSMDKMRSKSIENTVALLLYFACYHPLPSIFGWLWGAAMQNSIGWIEYDGGSHRWYLVYYLLCNLVHSWVFMPLREIAERSSPGATVLCGLAMTSVMSVLCMWLVPLLPLYECCGQLTKDDWKLGPLRWVMPKMSFDDRQWLTCILVIPWMLHLFIVYTVAWWFGPCLIKWVRQAPIMRWLDWLGALLPLSLFVAVAGTYVTIFPHADNDNYQRWFGVTAGFLMIWATAVMANRRLFPLKALAWCGQSSLATYIVHVYMMIRLPRPDVQTMAFFRFRDHVLIPAPEEAFARVGHWPGSDLVKMLVLLLYTFAYMATFGHLFQQLLMLMLVLSCGAAKLAVAGWSRARRACADASMGGGLSGEGAAAAGGQPGLTWLAWQRLRAQLLDGGGVVCLDGGTSSELERQATKSGQDQQAVNHSGWSYLQWRTHPDLLRDVHASYLREGASIVISNSHATNRHIMKAAGFEDLTVEATLSAVRLACEARDGFIQEVAAPAEEPRLVAGSVSCHPPGVARGAGMDEGQWPPREVESAGYREQVQLLADGGADMIFVEMVWEWREHGIVAARSACASGLLVALCLAIFDAPSCKEGMPRLHDGTLVEELAREISQGDGWQNVVALCVHHTKLPLVLPCLRAIRKGGWSGVVGAYPDHDTFEMPYWRFEPLEANTILKYTEEWVREVNCQMIGGGCGIGPETIKEIGRWCSAYNARCDRGPSLGSTTASLGSAGSCASSDCGSQPLPPPLARPLPVLVSGSEHSGLAAAREYPYPTEQVEAPEERVPREPAQADGGQKAGMEVKDLRMVVGQ